MKQRCIYRLDRLSVIDICGQDASTIVHNVTTNDVKKIEANHGCETFITDIRGKTFGHGFVFRETDGLRFVGSAGQSKTIAEHIDRYTITEDATTTIRDDDYRVVVIPPNDVSKFPLDRDGSNSIVDWSTVPGGRDAKLYLVPWLGEGTAVILVPFSDEPSIDIWLNQHSIARAGEPDFHHARILAGYPWYGLDLTADNLPQEANRETETISFTKGCYLGQETVARLDALGQVQKKLVRWSIRGAIPAVNTTLESDGKTVGRLTSVTRSPTSDFDAIAIGFARRSHFDAGATATGNDPNSKSDFVATVFDVL